MPRLPALACALALVLVAPACGDGEPGAGPTATPASSSSAPQRVQEPHRTLEPRRTRTSPPSSSRRVAPRVLAISIDGLNPEALARLGPAGTPALHRMLAEGADTLDARTAVEQTVTLPNHTGMVTGRRIEAAQGGHGVTWNEDLTDRSIGQVPSVFTVVHAAGRGTAVFAGKSKFSLFDRSWPDAVDRSVIHADPQALTSAAIDDLATADRAFTFLHLAGPDLAGHASGFMSPAYLEAVRGADVLVGQVLAAVEADPALRRSLTVVLTSDHGGDAAGHGDPADPDSYTVPFVVWGPGISDGDLYALNPEDYRAPGDGRPSYAGVQPVRNADVANLATALLGLGPVPGSELGSGQDLTVATR